MRKVIELQMKLGEIGIKDIEFDLKSRDETTKLLIGIQSIYCDKETIDKAFEVLVELIPENIDQNRFSNFHKCMFVRPILALGQNTLEKISPGHGCEMGVPFWSSAGDSIWS